MSDDLIYWSYCSPVRVREKQPEFKWKTIKKKVTIPKEFREAPHFMEQSQNAFQSRSANIFNQMMQAQRFNQQASLGNFGRTFGGLFSGSI